MEFLRARPTLWQTRPLVVLGDNDAAGQEGATETARRLGSALGKSIIVEYPPEPIKDMRDWIVTGTFISGWPCVAQKEDQR